MFYKLSAFVSIIRYKYPQMFNVNTITKCIHQLTGYYHRIYDGGTGKSVALVGVVIT